MSRVALYADSPGNGLVRCAQTARQHGDRVVTVVRERFSRVRQHSLSPVLGRLVARMQAGEFEAVVAALDGYAAPVRLMVQEAPGDSIGTRPCDAAIYARVAAVGQAADPIGEQAARLRERAASRGWKVVGTYVDPARSGLTLDRSGFVDMMAAAERSAFEVLLVKDLDRISRDAAGLHGVIKTLRALGVVICTLDASPQNLEAQVVRRVFENYIARGGIDDAPEDGRDVL